MRLWDEGTLIIPRNDLMMIRSKHWLIARNIPFVTRYIPVDQSKKQLIIIAKFTWYDKLLYKLTLGKVAAEKIEVFG